MRRLGLTGAVRGKAVRTTVSDPDDERASDLVKRQFTAGAPNRLWVADFTYVATWSGAVYVAFAIDVFSRRIVGWSASMSKETDLVLDAIESSTRRLTTALVVEPHADRVDEQQIEQTGDRRVVTRPPVVRFAAEQVDCGLQVPMQADLCTQVGDLRQGGQQCVGARPVESVLPAQELCAAGRSATAVSKGTAPAPSRESDSNARDRGNQHDVPDAERDGVLSARPWGGADLGAAQRGQDDSRRYRGRQRP
jgi:hypothetical protein